MVFGNRPARRAGWPLLLTVAAALLFGAPAAPQTGGTRVAVNPADYTVRYSTLNDWGAGFTGEIAITNRSSQRLNNWQLELDFTRTLNQVWNASEASRAGARHTLQGMPYNSFIAPGATVTFGFNGTPGGAGSPADYRLTADASPSTGGGGTGSASVRYRTTADWGAGFVGEVTVKNTGTSEITDWRVEFDLARSLTQVWNAKLLSSAAGHFVFGPETWNVRLAAGQEATFGFQGQPGNVAAVANLVFKPVTSGGGGGTGGGGSGGDTGGGSGPPAPPRVGFLRTNRNQIVAQDGTPVRLTGLNWFGMETSNFAPHGLWTRSMNSMLDQMATLGYNCLRVPFCNQLFDAGSTPNGIDFNQNPDLVGKSGIQIMDALVSKAGARGMKIILDRHRPGADGQSELWYTSRYGEERWISDWVMLAQRYKANPTVVGFDLHNEPHGSATWGSGNVATDWRLAAERAGNRILAVNPNLLIIVEGIEVVDNRYYWWGGNLKNAGSKPVRLNVANQLVYSAHDYPTSVYFQPWFRDPQYPANMPPLWDEFWGYLMKQEVAPVLVGEFGTFYQSAIDRTWLDTLAVYLRDTGASFTYWSWNPNSGDTGGLLMDDWRTVHAAKHAVLQPLLAPLFR